MIRLVAVEARRTMRRREVWLLLAAGVLICVIAGVVGLVDSAGKEFLDPGDPGVPSFSSGGDGSDAAPVVYEHRGEVSVTTEHPAVMRTWWSTDDATGILGLIVTFAMFGALIGGAQVVGGEWKAGTVANALLWEPRRARLASARVSAVTLLAFVLGLAIQAAFLAALTPAVLINGTTAGTGGDFWVDLLVAMARFATMAAAAASLGAGLAFIARSTAGAVFAVFGWMAVLEPVLRARWPRFGEHLVGENLNAVFEWRPIVSDHHTVEPGEAAVRLVVYVGVVVALGIIAFRRRDLPARA